MLARSLGVDPALPLAARDGRARHGIGSG